MTNTLIYVSQVYGLINYLYKGVLMVWEGVNNSRIETSNQLLQAYAFKGLDDFIDASTVKQLYKYNRQAFDHYTKAGGIVFVYQDFVITLKQDKKGYTVSAYNVKTEGETPLTRLTATSIRNLTLNGAHRDLTDVLGGLIKKLK